MGAVQDALRDSRAALQALGRPRPGQRSLALAMRVGLAGALAKSGDLAAGIGELKAVIGEVNALGRGKTVGAATFHNNLAVLLWRSGDPLGALAAVERALAIPGDSETINPGTLWMHRARHLLSLIHISEPTRLL